MVLQSCMITLLLTNNRKLIYAMDALFGIPKKKAAGVSHRAPPHGHLVFLDQSAVDDYVVSVAQAVPQKRRNEEVIILLFLFV